MESERFNLEFLSINWARKSGQCLKNQCYCLVRTLKKESGSTMEYLWFLPQNLSWKKAYFASTIFNINGLSVKEVLSLTSLYC